ncbi:hypothetical protein [Streptomyces sp. MBT53]|uniref:hypothetical protein n=1 Tax=Streptomyces sp. MBT53 TaxID=1488384 RepID=UPI001914A4BF|nr:hypothetical protein [Streptomyces sp. MBT53]MBK6017716.1 hypothetical protein [Streptomyces sp. MBT53]
MRRRILNTALVLASTFGLSLVSANAAQAGPNGTCALGEVCLYYNSAENGLNAYFPQTFNIPSYKPYAFVQSEHGGTGANQSVYNNAAYVYNRSNGNFGVFYNSSYSCAVACQEIISGQHIDLNSTMKNNNASGGGGGF